MVSLGSPFLTQFIIQVEARDGGQRETESDG